MSGIYSIMVRQAARPSILLSTLVLSQLLASPTRAETYTKPLAAHSSSKVATSYGPPEHATLYEEDPSRDTTGGRYVGSVVWHTEAIKRGNHKTDMTVRADVTVPDRRFKMTMLIFRNVDVSSLQVNCTAEFSFILPANFVESGGGVDDMPGLLMKPDERGKGVALKGAAVKVADGFFRINFSNVDAERSRNLQLLKEAPWFSIPLIYHNLHRAILTLEKGKSGYRAFKAAFGRT